MELLGIGVRLTFIGMGLVFLLLAVLALLITVLLRLDKAEPAGDSGQKVSFSPFPAGLDPDAIAAILIAVTRHRMVRRKEAAPYMRQHMPGTLPSRWVTTGRSLQNRSWHPGRRNP